MVVVVVTTHTHIHICSEAAAAREVLDRAEAPDLLLPSAFSVVP